MSLERRTITNTLTRNSQNKEACRLNGQYQMEEIVYECTPSSSQPN